MADTTVYVEQTSPAAILRQLVVMLGIAASVALGVYVVMWAREPSYTLLYTDLSERDLSQVADALKTTQIPYQIEAGAGSILVDAGKADEARMKLAAAGLPKGGARGFELLEQQEKFGTSQFLERARYQHAIEGELSRSIARIDNVRGARVHLALPAESVFARHRKSPSASVIIDLYPGRGLDPQQIDAITHLVAASVPNLPAGRVTIVDSRGNLLMSENADKEMAITAQRYDYARRLEQSYIERIEQILAPLVGPDGVRAQVNADLDFTISEQTRESFNPDLPAVRSERLLEEERSGNGPGGVPGALSNSPPADAAAPEAIAESDAGADGAVPGAAAATEQEATPQNRRKQTTRNYELDRTISHTRPSTGTIRRLSVAVVVRNVVPPAPAADPAAADAGDAAPAEGEAAAPAAAPAPVEFTPEQIERMTQLVRETIGFDAARGDTVSVTGADFLAPPMPAAMPEPPLWEQPWVWNVAKQAAGALFVLFLVFGVLKPTIRSMLAKPALTGTLAAAAGALPGPDGQPALAGAAAETLALPGAAGAAGGTAARGEIPLLASGAPHENIEQVRNIVVQDPRVAAQVIKGWVGE
ncbi:MAG: flagellar basal-body MS-ring/collar protein FliF [Gammaproteobacteria bacterium]